MDATSRSLLARDGTRIAWYTHAHPTPLGDRSGASLPLVVLTNGLSTTPSFWKHIVPALTPFCRVVHWDYRGHGASEPAASGDYSIEAHADDLARVTEAALDEGPQVATGARGGAAIHVAFSMGVTVLLEVVRRRPRLVRGMALLAGGADHPYASAPVLKLPGLKSALRASLRAITPLVPERSSLLARAMRARAVVPAAQAMGALAKDAPREELAAYFAAFGAMNLHAYWKSIVSLAEARAADVLPTVERLGIPVLLVAPERDVMVLQADLQALRRALPHARWVRFPGTSHAMLLEVGPEVAREVKDFVRDVR